MNRKHESAARYLRTAYARMIDDPNDGNIKRYVDEVSDAFRAGILGRDDYANYLSTAQTYLRGNGPTRQQLNNAEEKARQLSRSWINCLAPIPHK